MSIRSLFSDTDLARIREAVARTEASNAGEIVPYLIAHVDEYNVAHWRAATLCAVMTALVSAAVHTYGGFWWGNGMLWILLPSVSGAGAGYALAYLPAIRRLLLTGSGIDCLVRWRAQAAFLEEEVFRTQDRAGILIFVAVFEHRAVILADEGINRAVPADLWREVVAELVDGIGAGRAADALCAAIDRCGKILQEYGIERRPHDRDELINGLRVRER